MIKHKNFNNNGAFGKSKYLILNCDHNNIDQNFYTKRKGKIYQRCIRCDKLIEITDKKMLRKLK